MRPELTSTAWPNVGQNKRAQKAAGFLSLSLLGLWFLVIGACDAHAQLAITEVMPSAVTACVVAPEAHPDFWELTNYGSEPVSLAGYGIWDANNWPRATRLSSNIVIRASESIIFVRLHTTITNAATFREWWWGSPTGGPPGQIIFYGQSPGFDQTGETLFLWDAQGNLIDRMTYPEVPEFSGITLSADPNGGAAAIQSETNFCGAFRSPCNDIGSPGFAPCGPIDIVHRAARSYDQ